MAWSYIYCFISSFIHSSAPANASQLLTPHNNNKRHGTRKLEQHSTESTSYPRSPSGQNSNGYYTVTTSHTLDNISQKEEPVGDERAPCYPQVRMKKLGIVDFLGLPFMVLSSIWCVLCVGSGIMSLPATLRVLGLVLGVALIMVAAFLTEALIEMLVRFSKPGAALSYGDLMGDAFGRIGKILLHVCVIINNIGVLIVYLIIIEDVLSGSTSSGVHHSGVLEEWFGEHWWTGRAFVLIVLTVAIFVPLICFKCIDSLRFSSAISFSLAVLFLIVVIGVTIHKLIMGSIETPTLFPSVTDLASFCDIFTAAPVVAFDYVCHYNVHTIESELEGSPHIIGVVQTSLALCATGFVMTGLFGFLLFGRPLASDNFRFAIISMGLVVIILLGAIFIPTIWVAFEFTGATVGVLLAFIFPASISLKDPLGIAIRKDKIISICVIILAVFSNVIAIYSDAYALLT